MLPKPKDDKYATTSNIDTMKFRRSCLALFTVLVLFEDGIQVLISYIFYEKGIWNCYYENLLQVQLPFSVISIVFLCCVTRFSERSTLKYTQVLSDICYVIGFHSVNSLSIEMKFGIADCVKSNLDFTLVVLFLQILWKMFMSFVFIFHNGFKSVFILSVYFYIVYRTAILYNPGYDQYTVIAVSLVFVLIALLCLFRTIMVEYARRFCDTETENTLKFILNEMPESILIMDQNMAVKYQNKYFSCLFKDGEDESIRDILQSIKRLKVRESKTFEIDSKTPSPTHRLDKTSQNNWENIEEDILKKPERQSRPISFEHLSEFDTLLELCFQKSETEGIIKHLRKIRETNSFETLTVDCIYEPSGSDPRSIEVKISISKFTGEDCLVFIFRDTTERDRIASLEDNNHYKDRLLASVSHELRTPLNGNINMIEAAIHEPTIPEPIKDKYLVPAVRSGKLLMHLINDILDFSQMNANKLRLSYGEGDIRQTVKQCVQLIEIQAQRKGLVVSVEVDSDVPKNFSTDHNRLEQIIMNLISNSLKFTFSGSIAITVKSHQNNLIISVQDTGIGISKEDQKKLFKPFTKITHGQSNDINKHGVGLGLSIANALAIALSGSAKIGITVFSKINEGSHFSFIVEEKIQMDEIEMLLVDQSKTIPLRFRIEDIDDFVIEPPSDVNKIPYFRTNSPNSSQYSYGYFHMLDSGLTGGHTTRSGGHTTRNPSERFLLVPSSVPSRCQCPKILAVDDDGFNLMALECLLKQFGLTCDLAYHGKEAIEKVKQRSKLRCGDVCNQYSLIFMDCSMPILDGYEATRMLKSFARDNKSHPIPIIGCTAFTTNDKIQECRDCGMDDYVAKPLAKMKLHDVLKKYDLV